MEHQNILCFPQVVHSAIVFFIIAILAFVPLLLQQTYYGMYIYVDKQDKIFYHNGVLSERDEKMTHE
jgi:hypothetical protein